MGTRRIPELDREEPVSPLADKSRRLALLRKRQARVKTSVSSSTSPLSIPGAFPNSTGAPATPATQDFSKTAGHLFHKLKTLGWNHKAKVVCLSAFLFIALTQCDCRKVDALKQQPDFGGALNAAKEDSPLPFFYESAFVAPIASVSPSARVAKPTLARARSTSSSPLPLIKKQRKSNKGGKAASI